MTLKDHLPGFGETDLITGKKRKEEKPESAEEDPSKKEKKEEEDSGIVLRRSFDLLKSFFGKKT